MVLHSFVFPRHRNAHDHIRLCGSAPPHYITRSFATLTPPPHAQSSRICCLFVSFFGRRRPRERTRNHFALRPGVQATITAVIVISMGKRRRLVPATVHSELSDYAHLMRAIRTERTTDLTGHLLNHAAAAASSSRSQGRGYSKQKEEEEEKGDDDDDGDGEEGDEGDEDNGPSAAGPRRRSAVFVIRTVNDLDEKSAPGSNQTMSGEGQLESQECDNEEGDGRPKKRRRKNKNKANADMWTRWPLESLPVPEWSFEDEVMHIAAMHFRSTSSHLVSSSSSDNEEGDAVEPVKERKIDNDGDADEIHIPGLVETAEHHLDHVLATLAAHLPAVAPGMHKRLAPLNWEAVLGALEGVAGVHIADETLDRTRKRLEAIYMPQNVQSQSRWHASSSARDHLAALEATSTAYDVCAVPRPPSTPKPRSSGR